MKFSESLQHGRARVLRLFTPREGYLVFALLVFALVRVRISLWWIVTDDTKMSFLPWLQTIQAHGGFHALREPVGDYFPIYFATLAADSYLGRYLSALGEVKLIPLVFDVVSAVFAYRIVTLLTATRSAGRLRPALAFLAVFALPSFLIDGALWGQCDSYLIGLELGVLFFLLRDAPMRALICFGLAFAMKIQVLFLSPLLLVALLRGRMRWWQMPVVPAVWLLTLTPSLAAGRSVRSALNVFSAQTESFPYLAMNMANWWQWLRDMNFPYRTGVLLGLAAGAAACLLLAWLGWRAKRLTGTWMLFFASASLLIVPFMLPKMHDRYLLPGSVFLVVLTVCDLRFAIPAMLMEVSNLLIFSNYFRQRMDRTTTDVAVLLAVVAIGVVARELAQTWRTGELEPAPEADLL